MELIKHAKQKIEFMFVNLLFDEKTMTCIEHVIFIANVIEIKHCLKKTSLFLNFQSQVANPHCIAGSLFLICT